MTTDTICVVCEHRHGEKTKCGYFLSGTPLFTNNACQCPATIKLDDIDEALYVISQNLPPWEQRHLKRLAAAVGRSVPELPSRSSARIYGTRAFEKAASS
jgi:hypothetical protein